MDSLGLCGGSDFKIYFELSALQSSLVLSVVIV